MARLALKTDFKDGQILYGNELNTNNKATNLAVTDNYDKIMQLDMNKVDTTTLENELATKVDITSFNEAIESLNTVKANVSLVNTKADKTEVALKADKTELQEGLATKADLSYVDSQLNNKADKSTLTNALELKADKLTTYTKEETNAIIDEKTSDAVAAKADTSYVNSMLLTKANASDVGNVNNLMTTSKVVVDAINEIKSSGSIINNIDYKSITKNESNAIQTVGIIDKNEGNAISTWTGTKEEYDALETKDANTLYYINDDYEEPEITANKVTTISADVTDKQYPSAKAVYDAIQDIPSGGGGTGTNNYDDLSNQPQINGVTLTGNKTSADLGIKQDYTASDIAFTDGQTFQQKYDAGELTGPQGPAGADGAQGPAGANATINGQNAINLVAGTNIDIQQEGETVTINSTGGSGGGATYTAGTNIEITEDNVINNTIPYNFNETSPYSVALGDKSKAVGTDSVSIGYNAIGLNSSAKSFAAIGGNSRGTSYSVSVGSRASSNTAYCVALGYYQDSPLYAGDIYIGCDNVTTGYNVGSACIAIGTAVKSKGNNTAVFGSEVAPINNMYYISSTGEKVVATTDLIDALETRIAELEAKVAVLEGGSQ